MFLTVINTNVRLKEAAGFGKSIVHYDQKAAGFRDYIALTEEVIEEEITLEIQPFKPYRFSPSKTKTEEQFADDAQEESYVKIVETSNKRENLFTDPYYYSPDALNHRPKK
jgi:hypothetical protein